jgi:hypothetical protein
MSAMPDTSVSPVAHGGTGAVLLGPNLVPTGQRQAVSSSSATRRAGREFRARMGFSELVHVRHTPAPLTPRWRGWWLSHLLEQAPSLPVRGAPRYHFDFAQVPTLAGSVGLRANCAEHSM